MNAPALAFESPVLQRGRFRFAAGALVPRAGAITVLLGPNGAGKTTALRLAAGLLAPDAGAVRLDGARVHTVAESERARRIAYVPQRAEVGAPFRVDEVVALAHWHGAPQPARVREALAAVGLADRASMPFHALSAGQQQRVVLARALAQSGPGGILLLDEAFAAVDAPEAAMLVGVLRERARAGATVLVASHDFALAGALADEVWFLRDGATVAHGPAAQLLEPAALSALLGMPVVGAVAPDGHRVAVPDLRAMLRPGAATQPPR
ncbi:MAG: ABC transporter ATP-binding protein [Phycisphaerales bacterium]